MKKIAFIICINLLFSCTKKNDLTTVVNDVAAIMEIHDTTPKLKCKYAITTMQLRAEEELAIMLSSECDSNRIYVPPGGTVTHAGLYTDSLMTKTLASTPSFYLMDDSINYMTVSNQLKGRFFLRYGSCHWGSEMWVRLE